MDNEINDTDQLLEDAILLRQPKDHLDNTNLTIDDSNSNAESFLHRYARYAVSALAWVWGACAGIPFYAPTKNAFEKDSTWGTIAAGITVCALGISASWALSKITKKLEPSPVVNQNLQMEKQNSYRAVKHMLSNVLGLLASIPLTFGTYKYNASKWKAIITFGADYGFKTFGYYCLFAQLEYINRTFKGQTQREMIAELIEKEVERALCQIYRRDPLLFEKIVHETDQVTQLAYVICACMETKNKVNTTSNHRLKRAANCLLYLVASANAVKDSLLGKEFFHKLFKNGPLSWCLGMISAAAGLSLGVYSINHTTDSLMNVMGDDRCNAPDSSLAEIKCGMYAYGMTILSLLLGTVTGVGDSYITHETTKHSKLKDVTLLLTCTTAIGNVIFHSFTMRQQMDDAVHYSLSRSTEHTMIQLNNLIKKYKNVNVLLSQFSDTDIENLFNDSNNEIKINTVNKNC
jgi:hypothetical protein